MGKIKGRDADSRERSSVTRMKRRFDMDEKLEPKCQSGAQRPRVIELLACAPVGGRKGGLMDAEVTDSDRR